MNTPSVWQELDHNTILNSVEQTLGTKLSNLLLKRNSYINRVYELEKYDSQERFIVKFYRPGRWTTDMILEEHNFLAELATKEIAVIPPTKIKEKTLFSFKKINYALFPKKGGRSMDEFNKETWEELGRLLARTHLVGKNHTKTKRLTWQPSIATKDHLEVLLKSDYLLADFKKGLQNTIELFIKKSDPLFNKEGFILIHGDCHKGNLIHRPNEGIYLIDFDDICLGPAIQDMWMLFPGDMREHEKELNWFLKGYETFYQFDQSNLDLIPALRGMRLIHFAAWLAIQSSESDFNNHFPECGTARYWNQFIKELQAIVYEELV